MKYLLPLFLAACSCSGSQPPPVVEFPHVTVGFDATVDRLRETTVALVVKDSDGIGRVNCSGVWIAPNAFLTAAHCTDGEFGWASHADIGHIGGMDDAIDPRPATLIDSDPINDLSLVYVDKAPVHPVAMLSFVPIVAGQRVHIVGHTAGLAFSYSPAWVSGLRDMDGPEPIATEVIQVFGGAYGGNSGGGLWDEEGNLMGICSYRLQATIHFFISRNVIVDFLTR